MPIPTSISDLSTDPGSNFPSGSDSPSIIDDVFREHAAYIAQIRDRSPDAMNVGYTPAGTGTGAVATTVQTKLRESVSVKDFGAVGDGVTDDTAAVQAAVTAALAADAQLYWPAGDYLTTASIANFHAVRHVGAGAVVRGASTFYVNPKSGQTNTVYVATTGSDANDGLSSAEPFLTTQAAGNIIYGYPYSDGVWKVQHAAGTYVASNAFQRAFPSSRRVQFLGAPVADGVTPTTVFDSPGGGGVGLSFTSVLAYVEDIWFTDYALTGVPSASGLGTGVLGDARSDILTRNVFATNCDRGIRAASETKLRVQAGILNANGVGVDCISNVTYTVGYLGTAADPLGVNGTAITNSVFAGVAAAESATGHVDFTYLSGNAIGVDLVERSRAHLVTVNITGNTTAIRARTGSTWYDNPGSGNTFTANTNQFVFGSNSLELTNDQNAFGSPLLVVRDPVSTGTKVTSSTVDVTALTYTLTGGMAAQRGGGFDVFIAGEVAGTAGTKTITVTLGASTVGTFTVAASTAEYIIRCKVMTNAAATLQIVATELIQNGVAPVVNVQAGIAEDIRVDKDIVVSHRVTNAADSNRLRMVEIGLVH